MKHRARKHFALLLTLALLLSGFGLSALAAAEYGIGNPYEGVDWNWGQYKTQLHVHSNASDGDLSIDELVEAHYALGYDILAITDHMTISVPWNRLPRITPLFNLSGLFGGSGRRPLSDERRAQILAGADRGDRGMMEITGSIELNGVAESHIGGFFTDYGHGLPGINRDYKTPIRKVQESGGVTLLNHVGRVTGADGSDNPRELYAPDGFWANKYARLFLDYPSLLGMDVNSKTDTETRNDRILYDAILRKVVPYGRTPWSFATSDAHGAGEFDRGWTVHLLPEKTPEALRRSMESGTFFGVNRYARIEAGENFAGTGQTPVVDRITVDEAAGTIAIDARYADSVTWIADGEIIATGATLKLADHDAEIGCYVRAYLLGPGGILYVQPFTVERAGQAPEKEDVPAVSDYSDFLRVLANIAGPLVRFTPLRLVVYLLTQFDPAYDLARLTGLFGG